MLLMTHMWCKTRNVHERQKMNDCMFHQVVMRTQEHAVSACYAVLGCAMLSRPDSDSADKIIHILLKKILQHSY